MENNERPTIDIKGLLHIAIVVKDVHKAAAEWGRLLGMDVKDMNMRVKGNDRRSGGEKDPRNHFRGDYNFGNGPEYEFVEADLDAPGLRIELIEPGEKGPFREYFDKHGTGIHHIAFRVGDQCDAINQMLIDDGYEYIVDTYAPNKDRWPVIDTEDVLGTNLCIKPGVEFLTGGHH